MTKFPELKVKIKSLTTESRDIKTEELKAKRRTDNETREKLYLHRINRVRPAARSTQLAYAYLRKRDYRTTEQCRPENQPNTAEIARMVSRYGGWDKDVAKRAVQDWIES